MDISTSRETSMKKNGSKAASALIRDLAASSASQAKSITTRRHDIKSWPEHFAASAAGLKPFEVRKNDRDYRVGDRITLHEWIPLGAGDGRYTGRTLEQDVIFITRNAIGLQEGYVSMGIAQVAPAT
jgi:hypothetical protein